jgi:hypothetical protein
MKRRNRRRAEPATSRLVAFIAPVVLLFSSIASIASVARIARADGEHAQVDLRYERATCAESCAGPDELRAAVAGRLGYDPFVAKESSDAIVVRIRCVASGLEGTIARVDRAKRAQGKPATITSKGSDCGELTAALAVGIAIAIDPLSITREPAAPPASPSPPPAPSAPPPAATAQPEAPAAAPAIPHDPTNLVVGVGPSLAFGALPDPSFGVRTLAGISHGMLEVDLEGRFDPPVGLRTPGGTINASLVLGTVAPCLRYGLGIACAQVSFGALRGTGLGFDHSREDNTLYIAAGARAGIEIPLGHVFAIRVVGEGQIPLRPTRLEADGAPVWSTPAFAFSAIPMLLGRFL